MAKTATPLEKYTNEELLHAATRIKVARTNTIISGIIRDSGLDFSDTMYKIQCKILSTNEIDKFNKKNNPEITDFNNYEKFKRTRKVIFDFLSTEDLEYYDEMAQYIIDLHNNEGFTLNEILHEMPEATDLHFRILKDSIKPAANKVKTYLKNSTKDKDKALSDYINELNEKITKENEELIKEAEESNSNETNFHNAHWYEYSEEDRKQLIDSGVMSPTPPDEDQFEL